MTNYERIKGMTFEEAVLLLQKQYEKAKQLTYVKKPLAWALYQVWKKADKSRQVRKEEE